MGEFTDLSKFKLAQISSIRLREIKLIIILVALNIYLVIGLPIRNKIPLTIC